MTQPIDERALEAAARALWDAEWPTWPQGFAGNAENCQLKARAAVAAYLNTIQETLVPNIEEAYNADFNNARNTMDVDALLEELNYLRFIVEAQKKADWEYSRV